jgi:hypothetical protein
VAQSLVVRKTVQLLALATASVSVVFAASGGVAMSANGVGTCTFSSNQKVERLVKPWYGPRFALKKSCEIVRRSSPKNPLFFVSVGAQLVSGFNFSSYARATYRNTLPTNGCVKGSLRHVGATTYYWYDRCARTGWNRSFMMFRHDQVGAGGEFDTNGPHLPSLVFLKLLTLLKFH